MNSHPYLNLNERAYWRSAVSDINPLETKNLWSAKAPLQTTDRVITFGSCFAQHLSRALVRKGFSWLDAEPAPEKSSNEIIQKFNYGVFSARTGNIYSTKSLRQWIEWAIKGVTPPSEVWEQGARFYDPFRPAIEPEGFASPDELYESRKTTLEAIRRGIEACDVFVFTLGLTEAWENREQGYTYATCPGTTAGVFSASAHVFYNYDFSRVRSELSEAIGIIREVNPGIRILLTVSPVPLTATASTKHVIVSTTYSKSVLRAVAGSMSDENEYIDYFPSYEIITAPSFRGMFFNPNMRTVSTRGVDFVMEHFLSEQAHMEKDISKPVDPELEARSWSASTSTEHSEAENIVCEEEILDSFSLTKQG